MKFSPSKRLVCAVAALLMIVLCASCAGGKAGNENTSSTGGDIMTDTETFVPDISFDTTNLPKYKIVYKNGTGKLLALDLSDKIAFYTGVRLETVKSDSPAGEYEIIVGDTDRSESADARKKLLSGMYSVSFDADAGSGRLVIAGYDTQELVEASNYFLLNFIQKDGGPDIESGFYTRNTIIRLRDPCVIVSGGAYYMCGTHGAGYSVVKSDDLYHWSDYKTVFDAATYPDFDGDGNYWAPELHEYNGSFYIFATYKSKKNGHRGVAVFKSDAPDGSYRMISDGHVTPGDWDAIDGTLYVGADGKPYMIFVHEWTSTSDGVGRMCVCELESNLSAFKGEITELFRADDAKWATGKITDGPFIYTTASGRLIMLWSNNSQTGYAVGIAYSDNGVRGPWKQKDSALYRKNESGSSLYYYDGGHAAVFTTLDGRTLISFHSPNSGFEAVTYREIVEADDMIRLK